jgi:hypothetical protein
MRRAPLKKGGCDGKEIKLDKIAYWAALCAPTFCTVLQVLLLNDKLLRVLVRKAKAMNHTVQMHCTQRVGTLGTGFPRTYADEIMR